MSLRLIFLLSQGFYRAGIRCVLKAAFLYLLFIGLGAILGEISRSFDLFGKILESDRTIIYSALMTFAVLGTTSHMVRLARPFFVNVNWLGRFLYEAVIFPGSLWLAISIFEIFSTLYGYKFINYYAFYLGLMCFFMSWWK